MWRSASSPRQRRSNRIFGVWGCDAIPYGKKDDADLRSKGAPWMMSDLRPLVRMLKFQSETATTWIELSGVIGSGRTHRWGVAEDRVMPGELFALLLAAAVGTRGHEQLCSSLRRPELHAPRRHCPESLCSAPLLAPSRCRCRFLPNWNAAEENAFLESVIFFCRGGLVCRLFSSSNS